MRNQVTRMKKNKITKAKITKSQNQIIQMNIIQDYDTILFKDVTFYASIRQLGKDEIEEGCKPQIKIWHSEEEDDYGEVATIRKVNNDFKVTFNDRYSHGYSKLTELNKVIGWVVEEVMKHPHFLNGKLKK